MLMALNILFWNRTIKVLPQNIYTHCLPLHEPQETSDSEHQKYHVTIFLGGDNLTLEFRKNFLNRLYKRIEIMKYIFFFTLRTISILSWIGKMFNTIPLKELFILDLNHE